MPGASEHFHCYFIYLFVLATSWELQNLSSQLGDGTWTMGSGKHGPGIASLVFLKFLWTCLSQAEKRLRSDPLVGPRYGISYVINTKTNLWLFSWLLPCQQDRDVYWRGELARVELHAGREGKSFRYWHMTLLPDSASDIYKGKISICAAHQWWNG